MSTGACGLLVQLFKAERDKTRDKTREQTRVKTRDL
jgi:hypothetical protein